MLTIDGATALLGRSPPERYPPTPPPSPAASRRIPGSQLFPSPLSEVRDHLSVDEQEAEAAEAEWNYVADAVSEASFSKGGEWGSLYRTTSDGLPGLQSWAAGIAHGVIIRPFAPLSPSPPVVTLLGSRGQTQHLSSEDGEDGQYHQQQRRQLNAKQMVDRRCHSVRCLKCGAFACHLTVVAGLPPIAEDPHGPRADPSAKTSSTSTANTSGGNWQCSFCGFENQATAFGDDSQARYIGASSREYFPEIGRAHV